MSSSALCRAGCSAQHKESQALTYTMCLVSKDGARTSDRLMLGKRPLQGINNKLVRSEALTWIRDRK